MSWCLADVVQLHGDPGFGASRIDTWNEGTPLIYPSVDPTAEGAMRTEGMEAVPVPQGQPIMKYSAPNTHEEPFVLPPDQRREGKPFILPPGEQVPNKPFILPPGDQVPNKPFLERNDQSLRRNPDAHTELQPAVGWQAPRLQEPMPGAGTMPTPAQVIPAVSQETSGEQPPAPLANVPPTPNTTLRTDQTPYPTGPPPQRPYSQFPYVK